MIQDITAVTDVLPSGRKCTGAVLTYDCAVDPKSVRKDTYKVDVRNIIDAFVGGQGQENLVFLSLDAQDADASVYFPGNPFSGTSAKVIPAKVRLRQEHPVYDAAGTRVLIADTILESSRTHDAVVDRFVQGAFEGLSYNLFIPENYQSGKKYPLVLFIHDASVCGGDPVCALSQGIGGTIWATDNFQTRHKCFVLVPQFAPPAIVDDDGNVDHRLEVLVRLLKWILSAYSIDKNRVYTTGQSMGCMASMVLNLRYPDMFAASLFVSGQWDERAFTGKGLEKHKFWFVTSQGDAKAFPGMNQILVALERDGARVAREVWNAKDTQENFTRMGRKLMETGANIFYTPFEMTSVADGWHSTGGEHHMASWQYAYQIDIIREWLFSQTKD